MKSYWFLLLGIIVLPLLLSGCNRNNPSTQIQHKQTQMQLGNFNFSSFQNTNTGTSQALGTTQISADDQAKITQAVLTYIKVKSNVSADDVKVVVEKRDGDYARASVVPIKPVIDAATVFLKYQAGNWQVLSLGTAFDINFYLQNSIPQDLQLKKNQP